MADENIVKRQGTGSALLGSIPIVGNIAQSFIESLNARRNQERQNTANKQMADLSYSRDLEMWNRGNEYNAPMAQMDRLKKAGLNPNLVYGSGAVAGQSAQSLPKYQAPQMEYSAPAPIDTPRALGAYQDFQLRNAQIDNLKAQRNATNQETVNKTLNEQYLRATLQARSFFERDKAKKMNYDAALSHNKNDVYAHDLNYFITKNRNESLMSAKNLEKMGLEMARITADTEMKKQMTDLMGPKFWAQMGMGAFGALGKVGGLFGKGAKAAGPVTKQFGQSAKSAQKSTTIKNASERIKTWNKKYGTRPGWQPFTKD